MNFKMFMTSGVDSLVKEGVLERKDILIALSKFTSNDWGILCDEDKEFQNELLKNPKSKYVDRFMGVYMINEIKIWIMSEYDYSIKELIYTVLLPEEY